MANPGYVRSTDGNNADNGSTWALANADLTGAIADAVAGDRMWVSDNHAQTQATSLTLAFPGTVSSPNQILCGDDAAEPPTALATTATVTTTSNNAITISGHFYWYGVGVSCGTGGSSASLTIASADNNNQVWEDVKFTLGTSNSNSRINIGQSGVETACRLINPTLKFGDVGQGLQIQQCRLRVEGGSIDGTGSAITLLLRDQPLGGIDAEFTGFDFSAAASTLNMIAANAAAPGIVKFIDCVMPASWSGSLFAGLPINASFRGEMWNCAAAVASGTNNFSMLVADKFGSARHETTIVRTGGASDGDTPISWKITTETDAEYPSCVFRSPEIAIPLTSTGSKTFTVHFVSDENVAGGQGAGTGNAFRDDEVWLEVVLLGTTDSPKGTRTTGRSSVVATPSDHASSSETWTTTGLTTPQTLKAVVTATNNEECVALVTICVAKASKTIYFCPKVEVS